MRQKLHLMAISAKGKSIEQAFLVIYPFNEDLLYLIYDRHCAKHNEEYKDSRGSVSARKELWPFK